MFLKDYGTDRFTSAYREGLLPPRYLNRLVDGKCRRTSVCRLSRKLPLPAAGLKWTRHCGDKRFRPTAELHHKPEPGCGTLADGLVETIAGNSIKNEDYDLSFTQLVRSSPRQQYENVGAAERGNKTAQLARNRHLEPLFPDLPRGQRGDAPAE